MDSPFPHLRLARPLIVIDVETTGLIPSEARVVEFAALKLQPGVRPGMLHGIIDFDVRNLPPFEAYARRLASFLEGADLAG